MAYSFIGLLCSFVLVISILHLVCRAEWRRKKAQLMSPFSERVSPDNAWPEYPRPQMRREKWKNLNGIWSLEIIWKTTVESIHEILVPFPVESALSGVMQRVEPRHILRYTRKFTVPSSWNGSIILMHFDAVDWEANVTVNGFKVAYHTGGYTRFTADITNTIDRINTVVVTVRDPTDASYIPRGKQNLFPDTIFYTASSGIWQTVWLEPVPSKNYIISFRITPNVALKSVSFRIRCAVSNERVEIFFQSELGDIFWGSGKCGSEINLSVLTLFQPAKFWTPDKPYLYRITIMLPGSRDKIDSYFAMREFSFGPDAKGILRYMLNGKPIFLAGLLDQGYWPDGLYTPPNDAAILFDLHNAKYIFGMNTIRKHLKVEPDRWYFWCDVLGILVQQDMPSGDKIANCPNDIVRAPQSAQNYYKEWEEIMRSKWNHPSIVVWVPFNEGWGQFNTSEAVRRTKELDPHRLVVAASGYCDHILGDIIDFHIYAAPDLNPMYLQRRNGRVAQFGEFGAIGLKVKDHEWNPYIAFSPMIVNTTEELQKWYDYNWVRFIELAANPKWGFSGGIFVQLADVETEVNGLLTYDRKVAKFKPNIWPASYAQKYLFGDRSQELAYF